MNLISVEFFIFFLIIFIIYYLLPGKLQWMWLLLAGMYFDYRNAAPIQCLVFAVFLILNYIPSLNITPIPNIKIEDIDLDFYKKIKN